MIGLTVVGFPSVHFSRVLFTTGEGSTGLRLSGSQVGDFVTMLKGTLSPFVPRKPEGHYTVVGEAYLHGVMTGECLNMGNLKIEEVVIHGPHGGDTLVMSLCLGDEYGGLLMHSGKTILVRV